MRQNLGGLLIMKYEGKKIPYSPEAEQAVLGALIIDSSQAATTLPCLSEKMFYKPANQLIFNAINDLNNAGKNIDYLTVIEKLSSQNQIENVGGKNYIVSLSDHAVLSSHTKDYADIVIDKFLRREEIKLAEQSLIRAYESEDDYETRLTQISQQVLNLSQYSVKREAESISAIANETLKNIIEQNESGRKCLGVSTGFDNLNGITSGLQKNNLITLAARPGIGKSSFALQIAANVAAIEEKPALIFSLEMSKGELMTRLLSSFAEINLNKLKRGLLNPEEIKKLYSIKDYISTLPIQFFDTSNITLSQIKLETQKYQIRYGSIGLIVIDYLQLIKPSNPKELRVNQVSDISRELKLLAKDLDVPVIAISTLSRAVESRENKRPQLSDLRESGTIEYDSDIVVFLYREDYYNPDSSEPGIVEVNIAKHRSGPLGKIKLQFEPRCCKFYE